jgi:hypothetical protein
VVWGIGSEDDQRLHGFDGDTGTNVFTGGGANELMAGTRRFNTGIVARGRIYVANDNKVYAFSVPGQTVTSITLTNPSILPGGAFQLLHQHTGRALQCVWHDESNGPFTNWLWLGEATEVSPGQFQFTDTQVTNNSERFYSVGADRSPLRQVGADLEHVVGADGAGEGHLEEAVGESARRGNGARQDRELGRAHHAVDVARFPGVGVDGRAVGQQERPGVSCELVVGREPSSV